MLDLDGTLYRQAPVRRGMAVRLMLHLARHPRSGWQTMRLLKAYRKAQEALRELEAASADQQLEHACRQCGHAPDTARVLVAHWMEERPLDLVRRHARPDLVGFLQAVRRKQVRLGLFSDYPAEAKLTAMTVRPYFDVVCCAQDDGIGVFKPNPRGLQAVLERLGVEAGEALYVGDRPDVDAAAARAAGMRAAIISERAPEIGPECLHVRSFRELGEKLGL